MEIMNKHRNAKKNYCNCSQSLQKIRYKANVKFVFVKLLKNTYLHFVITPSAKIAFKNPLKYQPFLTNVHNNLVVAQ